MSDEIFIGDKPLQSLRVVDLREELKKRGIRSSGTKFQLQQLLIEAITTNQIVNEPPPPQGKIETNAPENESSNNSNESLSNNSNDQSINSEKVASISINEEKETIKLTIRSSPRKSEPIPTKGSETEESQSDESDSDLKKNSLDPFDEFSLFKNKNTIENEERKIGTEEVSNNSKKLISSEEIKENEDISPETFQKSEQSMQEKINKINENKIEIDSETLKTNDTSKGRAILKGRLINQKSQEEASKPLVQKKRRWGGSQSNESSVLKKGISSEKLKQLINNSVMVENDAAAKVSKINEDETPDHNKVDEPPQQQQQQQPKIETSSIKEVKKFDISNKSIEMVNKNVPQKENGFIVEESEKNRAISPAKNPESTVLFITGLVRPYTLMQLKKLLNNTGKIDEEKFWIDKIKSKCYVTYASVEEAIETRKALHNLKWPQSSPKNLSIEFATLEDIDRCLHPENYEDLPRKVTERKILEDKDVNKGKYDMIIKEPKMDIKNKPVNKIETPVPRGIREWDRDKVVVKLSSHEEKEDIRPPKRHRSPEPINPIHREKQAKIEEQRSKTEKNKKDESNQRQTTTRSESPVNLLEDLFRKTKTIPYIYWLPLTEEQSISKEKQRAQFEKDREIRISRMEMSSRRSPPMSRNMMRPRSPINRRRGSPPSIRRKPSYSPPRRRYSRSRSPDRRRLSPRRR